MLDTILSSVVPMFFVMALGYLAGWTRDINNHHVAELNALVLDFALPASLFVRDGTDPACPPPGTTHAHCHPRRFDGGDLRPALLSLQTSLFKIESRQAAFVSLMSGLPNFTSAGLPLIRSVFGPENTVAVGISIAVALIVMSPLTLVIVEAGDKSAGDGPALRRMIGAIGRSVLKPVVIAPIVGMAPDPLRR